MKNKLESFKTDEIVERIIKGIGESRDFRLFHEIFAVSKLKQEHKDVILYSLIERMSPKALHKFVGVLLQEDGELAAGKIPNSKSLAGKAMLKEVEMHQGKMKENDSNIQKSLNIIMAHYPPEKMDKNLIRSAIKQIYVPLISRANPLRQVENYEDYSTDSLGFNYVPDEETLNNRVINRLNEEKNHKIEISKLLDEAYEKSVTRENLSLIKNTLSLDDKSKDYLGDFRKESEYAKKLPKEVHDPLEKEALKVLNDKIIPQINELVKATDNNSKNVDVDKFVNSIGDVLMSIGVNDFDKQKAAENLKKTYLAASRTSKIFINDRFLYSIGSLFKRSKNILLRKLGDSCHSLIPETSIKILKNDDNLKDTTSIILADALDNKEIAVSIRKHLVDHKHNYVKPSPNISKQNIINHKKSQSRG